MNEDNGTHKKALEVEAGPTPAPPDNGPAGTTEQKELQTPFARRSDGARKAQAQWNHFLNTVVAPLIMDESVLHPEGREINPSKLYMLVGGLGLGVLGVAAWGFLSIPRGRQDAAFALRGGSTNAAAIGQTQPQRPAQPQLPVQPIPGPQPPSPVGQQRVLPMQPKVQAQPQIQRPPQMQPRMLQAGVSRTVTGATPEQRRSQQRAEAMARVQMRSGNLGPLPGANRVNQSTAQSPVSARAPQLPPPQVLPQLPQLPRAMTAQPVRATGLARMLPPPPVALGLSVPVGAAGGGYGDGYQNARQTTSSNVAQGGPSYGQGFSGGNQLSPGSAGGQADQAPVDSVGAGYLQSPSAQALNGGVQQTQWGLIPPGNFLRVVTRSLIQVAKQGGSLNTPVFAQVKGDVRVDGEVVIPDGAMLHGRVINIDESLGRIRLEFTSLSFGNRMIALFGATAWSVDGNTAETAALTEGLLADAAGMPEYLFTDARSALGQGASSVARTLGQTTTAGVGAFGTSAVTAYSGDLSTALQRAAAQGLGTFFNRQASRADAATKKIESRGPIWTVLPQREFVIFLSQGV